MPQEWHAARDEFSRRRRQERYRRWVTAFRDPEFNSALTDDDLAVSCHNRNRALTIHFRQQGRETFKRMLRSQRRERWIVSRTPTSLRPIIGFILGTWLTRKIMRKAVADATRPVPEKRHYTQARNFTPKP